MVKSTWWNRRERVSVKKSVKGIDVKESAWSRCEEIGAVELVRSGAFEVCGCCWWGKVV